VPPPAAETTKPLEPPVEKQSPADKAADDALRQRLAEMTRAEGLQREAMQQGEHRLAAEPPQQPQQQQAMSAHVQEWLSKHPQFFNDAVAQAELNVATMKCVRDGLNWNDDNFIPSIERHLGFRQQPQPNGNGHAPAAPARNGAQPVRQQQRPVGPAVSAPPSRDAPSMSTGRATGRAPLTEAEVEIARGSGLSPEEYAAQKEKMNRLKAAGAIQ
jgi:hypothetical protein